MSILSGPTKCKDQADALPASVLMVKSYKTPTPSPTLLSFSHAEPTPLIISLANPPFLSTFAFWHCS